MRSALRSWAQTSFRAMGTDCRIVGPDVDAARHGETMVHDLERRWSRFRPDSEISDLNAAAGRWCILSKPTFELVACAERARIATSGAYNPLMLEHLERAGYDRTWDQVADSIAPIPPPPPVCREPIEMLPEVCGVRLPDGARFDPGGIGKGLAADLAAAELAALGAPTTQIELGGDVRLSGPAWDGGWWQVGLDVGDPTDDGGPDGSGAATVCLPEGGVATSSSVRRRWRRGGRYAHHLLDPATGLPAETDLSAATVVAPSLWWAEVIAKVAVIGGSVTARDLIRGLGMSAVLTFGADRGPRYEAIVATGDAA